MPSEITHKSAFRFGPFLWAVLIAAGTAYVLGVNGVGAENFQQAQHTSPSCWSVAPATP